MKVQHNYLSFLVTNVIETFKFVKNIYDHSHKLLEINRIISRRQYFCFKTNLRPPSILQQFWLLRIALSIFYWKDWWEKMVCLQKFEDYSFSNKIFRFLPARCILIETALLYYIVFQINAQLTKYDCRFIKFKA